MPRVETTGGAIEASQLGRTLTHEHAFTGEDAVRAQWPHAFESTDYMPRCIARARELRQAGVETVCDPSCLGIGRDVRINLTIAEETGLHFVMATGIYDMSHRGWHVPWSLRGTPEVLVEHFVHDIEVGIQGTPVKAGFIKCTADDPGMVPEIVALHEIAAQASIRTGAPIMAHSNPNAGVGLGQMKIFTEAGVDPARVQIAHVCDTEDLEYIEQLLATGCYIGFDRYGFFGPTTERRNATLLSLLERGYGDRILLSQDTSLNTDLSALPEELRNWYPTYLFERVLPDLRDSGVSEDEIDAMLGSNIHSWLTGATPAHGTGAAKGDRRLGGQARNPVAS